MIPKIIHYCWFGSKPLPELALKCIESWKKYLPDYEIKEWNEQNFDVNIIPYTKEAYQSKKYAFVSDYARFFILYKYGGIYFDTDVEVIKPLNPILDKGPYMGYEKGTELVAPGLGLAVELQNSLYKEILQEYEQLHFLNDNGTQNLTTIVVITTNILRKYHLVPNGQFSKIKNITIYPSEYFCPISTMDGKMTITDNTYTIHHYAASWVPRWHKCLRWLLLFIGGYRLKLFASKLKNKFN